MADNLRFVQFPHPGREHEPDPAGGKAWNTLNSQHARKFMEFGGKWIEDDGSARSGNLRAWGEWEAESDLVCGLIQPRQDSHIIPAISATPTISLETTTNGCTTQIPSSSENGSCIQTANK